MPKSEAQLVHDILLAWGSHPRVRVWRQNTGAMKVGDRFIRFGQPGAPDILSVMAPSGRMIGIECKSPKGKQSDEQRAWKKMLLGHGGVYILAREIEDVDRILEPLVGRR